MNGFVEVSSDEHLAIEGGNGYIRRRQMLETYQPVEITEEQKAVMKQVGRSFVLGGGAAVAIVACISSAPAVAVGAAAVAVVACFVD